jgi:protein-tyrosine phosphatase
LIDHWGNVSAKYAIQFGFLSLAAFLSAAFGVTVLAGEMVLIWVGVAFAVVAIAYGSGRPQLLMKREDGSQPMLAWIILWPYFLLARLSFLIYRLSHRSKVAVAEVLPGVWFARRLTRREIRDSRVSWSAVLDLAAEFPRVEIYGATYRSVPIMDGAVPSEEQLHDVVAWIDGQVAHGNVLVHCALGHGRTGSIILAWLLAKGHVSDVNAGMAHLLSRRSTFGMSKAQVSALNRFATNGIET